MNLKKLLLALLLFHATAAFALNYPESMRSRRFKNVNQNGQLVVDEKRPYDIEVNTRRGAVVTSYARDNSRGEAKSLEKYFLQTKQDGNVSQINSYRYYKDDYLVYDINNTTFNNYGEPTSHLFCDDATGCVYLNSEICAQYQKAASSVSVFVNDSSSDGMLNTQLEALSAKVGNCGKLFEDLSKAASEIAVKAKAELNNVVNNFTLNDGQNASLFEEMKKDINNRPAGTDVFAKASAQLQAAKAIAERCEFRQKTAYKSGFSKEEH
jgi:hypothetical protein